MDGCFFFCFVFVFAFVYLLVLHMHNNKKLQFRLVYFSLAYFLALLRPSSLRIFSALRAAAFCDSSQLLPTP